MQADKNLVYSPTNWWKRLESFYRIADNRTKLAMEPFPNNRVLAALANLAYTDCSRKLDLPEGWLLLTTARNNSRSNGYFGCAWWSPTQQQVVLAHRGTDPTCWGAILTDGIGVVCNMDTPHMNSAITFADDVKRAILDVNEEYGSRFVMSFTGHSLGAWLAGITTMTVKYLKRSNSGFCNIASPVEGLHAHTLALDSPGVEDMLIKISRAYSVRYDQSMYTKELDITTYFSAPNLVNTSGYHTGQLHQFHIKREALPSDSDQPNLLTYCDTDTHGIGVFIKAFDDAKDTYDVLNWPQGWDERRHYHELEKFSNSYILQAPPESSSGSHESTEIVVEQNAEKIYSKEKRILKYSTVQSLGKICHLGVFSTEEFNLIESWSLFQSNPLIELTEIKAFTSKQMLETLEFPKFKIKTRKNSIISGSKDDLRKVIGQTKQLLRWFPGIIDAIKIQNESIKSAPLYSAGQAYLRTLPNVLDCEDTLGLESFLESPKRVLQIIVTGDFEFEAARLHKILTSLDIKDFTHPNCHTILNWNDMHNTAIDFKGLNECDVTNNDLCILNFPPLTDSNQPQIPPDCDLMRTILLNLTLFNRKKLVIIRSQSIDEQLFDEFNLTVETKTLKTFELEDLTPSSREKVFSKDVITIGEEKLNLNFLLGNDCKTPNEKINQLITPILKNLVMDKLCIEKIPNNLPRLCQLDVLYSRGNKLVDRARLTALLERSGGSVPQLVISDPDQLSQDYWGEVGETARERIFTTDKDERGLFMEKCQEESALPIYWFHLSTEGFTLNEVYNRSVYLPRKFHSRLIIKSINEFVQYKRDKDLFIFINVKDKKLLIQTFDLSAEAEDALIKNNNFIVRSPSQELSVEDKKREDLYSKHYFEMLEIRGSPCLVWKYSEGSLDGLRPFVTRDHRDTIEEREFCVMKKKHTIIADDPGMGKTTILTRMSELIPESWVLRIDHKLLDDSSKNLPPRLDMKSVIQFLIHASSLPTDKKIVSNLLEHCLQSDNSRQVCVLVDAFDEIFDENKVKMAELLKYLKTATTCQTVVTTRVYQQKWLEKVLEEFAVELEKITEGEQEDYLVNFWLPHLALELPEHGESEKARLLQFARGLRKEVEGVLREDVASFMGIPLQIRMLAEVFLQQAILSVLYPEQVNNLRKITNLFDLYKQFIEVKKTIYFQKTNVNKLPPTYQKAMFKDAMEKHCVLAFQTIDPTFATEYFTNIKLSDLTTDEVKDISSFGLMKCKTDGTFHFIHRTFQEYFCADFFVRWLRQERNNNEENVMIKNEFCKFLLKPNYKIIRIFIETQLETMPISGEELENHPKMYQHWSEHRQLFFNDRKKTPLHIAAKERNTRIVGVLLSGPPSRTSDEGYISIITSRDKDGKTALKIALETGNTDIVNQITENVENCLSEAILGLMLGTFLDKENDRNIERSYFGEYVLNTQQFSSVNRALERTLYIRDIIFEPFIAAVRRDDYETVLEIFSGLESDTERAIILIATDGQGDNVINLATSKQNHTFFKLFAKQGVCVSYDKHKQTPLHCSAEEGFFDIVNFLLNQSEESYAHIDNEFFGKEIFKNRNVTLQYKNNSSMNSQEMLTSINSVSSHDDTALMAAVQKGHLEVIRILLKCGADINSANSGGYTALMYAAKNEHHEVTRMLLESGADTNSAESYGNTALIFAARGGQHEVTSMLLEFGADTNSADSYGNTALIFAARGGHHEVTRMLLESGADTNSADNYGNTALIFAAQYKHHEVTRMLLESGADTNSADRYGNTALIFVAREGHHEVTRMLLKSGADTNSADSFGNTALIFAVRGGHHEVTRMLLDSGADTNSADSYGNTALMLAAENGDHEVTRILLESGADTDAADSDGNTALILAAENIHHEVTRILLESEAKINHQNIRGETAMSVAASHGYVNIVRLLLQFNPNVSLQDQNGRTALSLAEEMGHQEIVDIFRGHQEARHTEHL